MKRDVTALLVVATLISALATGGCITVTNNYYGTPDAATASAGQTASNNSAYYYYNQGADWANAYAPWYSLFTYGVPSYYGSPWYGSLPYGTPSWYGGSCYGGLYGGGRRYYGFPYFGYRYTGYYPYQPQTPNVVVGGVCPPPSAIDNGGVRDGIDAKLRRDTSDKKVREVEDHGEYADDGTPPPTIRRDIRWGSEGGIRPVDGGNDIHPISRRDLSPPQPDRAADITPQPDVHVVGDPFPRGTDNGGRSSGTLEVRDGGTMVRIDPLLPETGGSVRERPVATEPVTVAPATAAPVHRVPEMVAPRRERPVEGAPAAVVPLHGAPAEIAPRRERPVEAAPVTAAPVHRVPEMIAPRRERPVEAAPAAAPVHAAPRVTPPAAGEKPVTAAPVTAAPLQATPIQAAPVTATPSATVATPR